MSVLNYSVAQRIGGPDLVNMEGTLNHSELFRAECKRLIHESDQACKRMQDEDSKQLDQRVRDIQFLKKELELKLDEIILETDVLVALQIRVNKALEMCKEPLRVTMLCLDERKKRAPSERLQDEVNLELLKEREVMERVVPLLERVAEQVTEQIRRNRSAKYHLEKDLKEKFVAQNIDNSCALMTVHSVTNQQMSKYNSTALPSITITPKQWENMSELNITKAEQQGNNSVSLRALVESVLQQTAAEMQKQFQATTAAIQLNIEHIKFAKDQMDEKLAKILTEINSQQTISEDLQASITEHEHFLSLAQTRMALRKQRPSKEQCHDPAQVQLLADIQQLTAHIIQLHAEMDRSKEVQRVLVRCQQNLQDSISIKVNSLYIEEVLCKQHREPIVIHNF